MSLFFTSDTHWLHENIIRLANRPFKDKHHMRGVLIDNWNATVKPPDTVYHLGDVALSWGRMSAGEIDDILSQLNGNKILIRGNHDRNEVVKNRRWSLVRDYLEIKVDVPDPVTPVVIRTKIVMMHYPLRSWNGIGRGSWMLHGHCHGNLPDVGGKIMDVGVDVHGFAPISLEEVRVFMDNRFTFAPDHHGERE